jgi:hypothetical protein
MTYPFDTDPDRQPPSFAPFVFDEPAPPLAEPEMLEEDDGEWPRPWRLLFTPPPEGEEIDRGEEIVAARDQRWTGRAVIVATIALAVLNAASLTSWASSLPPNWSTETIRAVANVWAGRLADLGLDQPRAIIRKDYEAQKAKRWN